MQPLSDPHNSDEMKKALASNMTLHDLNLANATACVLDYTNVENAVLASARLDYLLDHSRDHDHLRDSVKSITVGGYGSLANWTQIQIAIEHVRALETLHWTNKDPIPAAILDSLSRHHPTCKLYYEIDFQDSYDPFDKRKPERRVPIFIPGEERDHEMRARTRAAIIGSNNLYSLTATIEYGGESNTHDIKFVHTVLARCPNVRILNLYISRSGCVVGRNTPWSFDFTDSELAKLTFPPLEVLRLHGYSFDDTLAGRYCFYSPEHYIWPWNRLSEEFLANLPYALKSWVWRPRYYKGTQGSEIRNTTNFNLNGWLERMDFSQLHTLELGNTCQTTLHRLAPRLTGLKHFSLRYADLDTAKIISSFLESVPPLNSLHLMNIHTHEPAPLLDVVRSRHSQTLQNLTLRSLPHDEAWYNAWFGCENTSDMISSNSSITNAADIANTTRSFSQLQSLDLTLPRAALDPSQSNNTIAALASFPVLESLTLRFRNADCPLMREDNETEWEHERRCDEVMSVADPDPLINRTALVHLLTSVRAKSGVLALSRRSSASTPPTPSGDNPKPNVSAAEEDHKVPARPTASLQHLEVIVGPWESRNANGMAGPPRAIIGRWICKPKANVKTDLPPRFSQPQNQSQSQPEPPFSASQSSPSMSTLTSSSSARTDTHHRPSSDGDSGWELVDKTDSRDIASKGKTTDHGDDDDDDDDEEDEKAAIESEGEIEIEIECHGGFRWPRQYEYLMQRPLAIPDGASLNAAAQSGNGTSTAGGGGDGGSSGGGTSSGSSQRDRKDREVLGLSPYGDDTGTTFHDLDNIDNLDDLDDLDDQTNE